MQRAWMLAVVMAVMVCALPAAAQKQQKQQKPAESQDTTPLIPLTDQQTLETDISEMLGAWQIGDIPLLHKHYSDDVLVVSGFWEPPVRGWDNYVQSYQRQRVRMQGVQLNRSNTFLKVNGNSAWAVYQWIFTGQVDGQFAGYRGHTTLVFEKHEGKWLIVVNHTSLADVPPAAPAATPPAPTKPS